MAGKLQFEQLLESRTVKYVMFDVTWCGGLTEARKIAAMADAFELPIAPHTAGGTAAVLRQHAPFHRVAQRVDPGELPAVLRARLAGHAGEPHRAGGRMHTRARGKRLRHADQAGSLESPRGRPAGERSLPAGGPAQTRRRPTPTPARSTRPSATSTSRSGTATPAQSASAPTTRSTASSPTWTCASVPAWRAYTKAGTCLRT
jgi:hypothetical protein